MIVFSCAKWISGITCCHQYSVFVDTDSLKVFDLGTYMGTLHPLGSTNLRRAWWHILSSKVGVGSVLGVFFLLFCNVHLYCNNHSGFHCNIHSSL